MTDTKSTNDTNKKQGNTSTDTQKQGGMEHKSDKSSETNGNRRSSDSESSKQTASRNK